MNCFRTRLLFLLLFVATGTMWCQSGGNPFELQPRLSTSEQRVEEEEITEEETPANEEPANPFDLKRNQETESVDIASGESLIAEPKPASPATTSQQPIETGNGFLLIITFGLLLLATIVFIFFRTLYVNAYKAFFNDNMLWQLYRERAAGGLGRFVSGYVIFFLGAGLFTFFTVRYFGWAEDGNMLWQISQLTTAILVVFLTKHLVLSFLAAVLPVSEAVKRYSFTIMVFSLVLGLILVLASFLLLYAPEAWSKSLIFGVGGIVALVYFLRSVRGLFIASHYLSANFFHFLLYLCAVEIIPTLFLYKVLLKTVG